MKKIITTLFFTACLISVLNTRAANTKDTLSYLQSIVANKANYIGQPFSVLLNNLQIQIKHFSPIAIIQEDKNKETATFFSFYFPQSAEEIYLTYPCLRISWQTSLNAATSRSLYKTNNGGGWTQAVVDFYKNAIIKDIDIFE